jgi:hypothetical protein
MTANTPHHPVALRIEGVNAAALTDHSVIAQRLFPELHAAAIPVAGGVASFVGAKSPLSYAVGLGLNGPVSADEISAVVKFYRALGAVPRVDVCTLADGSLLEQLRAHGFQLHGFVNVLTRSISGWDKLQSPPAGIKVRATGLAEAEAWARLVAEGFLDGKPYTEIERHLGLLMYHRDSMRGYIAELDGEPVGAGALFTEGGYAALVAASTRAEFRGRGVQAALICARLLDAQKLDCELAGLFAMPGSISQRNAERYGFRLTYTKAIMKLGA